MCVVADTLRKRYAFVGVATRVAKYEQCGQSKRFGLQEHHVQWKPTNRFTHLECGALKKADLLEPVANDGLDEQS